MRPRALEFNNVFLPGWEEEVFPNRRSVDDGGGAALEEERRLAYVGLTRARQRVCICHASSRRVYNQWLACAPPALLLSCLKILSNMRWAVLYGEFQSQALIHWKRTGVRALSGAGQVSSVCARIEGSAPPAPAGGELVTVGTIAIGTRIFLPEIWLRYGTGKRQRKIGNRL